MAYALNLDNNLEEIKLEVGVNEHLQARFEITYLMSTAKDYMEHMPDGYPVQPIVYNGYKKKWRILSIQRLDKYAGPCEQKAQALNLEAELCICPDNI